ncbi:hypothetical protein AALO_G00049820 [Alosa alosa]|uniref:Uncharacterized protein n=1 Tax=Alosa alosa TaxID=278164 RepID=A0AAV6H4B6_9TELE|nr:hypothetical protein AALO_G00049820 [Alosa alosa]
MDVGTTGFSWYGPVRRNLLSITYPRPGAAATVCKRERDREDRDQLKTTQRTKDPSWAVGAVSEVPDS